MEKSSSRDCGYSFDANGQAFFIWYSKELVSLVQLGSSACSFGKGNRLLQGFVIGFGQEDSTSLKLIQTVLDPEPVLNQEQLTLADQLRKTVFLIKSRS